MVTFIGDVHGWADRLARLADQAEGQMILVGDLIDRGPHTAKVLRQVQAWCEQGRASVILGNHEWQLIRALGRDGNGGDEDAFETWVEDWGGHAVLRSYHVQDAAGLRRALGATWDWLVHLPWVLEGAAGAHRWIAVHAGLEEAPLRPQLDALRSGWSWYGEERPLPLFTKRHLASFPRDMPSSTVLVSGHTPLEQALVSQKRILCDTSGGLPGRPLTGVVWPGGRIITG